MNWPCYPLGNILTLEYGSALPESEREPSGRIPVAGSNGITGYHSKALVKGPGIVVGRKGSAGKINWLSEGFWPIDTTYYVRLHIPSDMRWVYYLLQHLRLEKLSTVTGVPGLNRNDVSRLQVPLPSTSEQRRIVEILDQADAIRKKRAEADAKTERILPAIFHKMFGDPATNPKGWRVFKVADVAEVQRGDFRHRPRTEPRFYGGQYPFIQINDVTSSRIIIRKYTQTLNQEGLAISRLFPSGTVVLSIAATIAASGILGFESCFPDSLVGVKGKPDLTTQEFLLFYFRSMAPRLIAQAPQLAQKNINLQILNDLDIPLPPLGLQKLFSLAVAQVIAISDGGSATTAQLDKLWASVLHQAFSGDLTAKWRKAHMKELLAEMQAQQAALKGNSNELQSIPQ